MPVWVSILNLQPRLKGFCILCAEAGAVLLADKPLRDVRFWDHALVSLTPANEHHGRSPWKLTVWKEKENTRDQRASPRETRKGNPKEKESRKTEKERGNPMTRKAQREVSMCKAKDPRAKVKEMQKLATTVDVLAIWPRTVGIQRK